MSKEGKETELNVPDMGLGQAGTGSILRTIIAFGAFGMFMDMMAWGGRHTQWLLDLLSVFL